MVNCGLFRAASLRTGLARFPGITALQRLRRVRDGVAWMVSWQGWQTTRVLRRFLAMRAAHGGWPGPDVPSRASLATWWTATVVSCPHSSHRRVRSRRSSSLRGTGTGTGTGSVIVAFLLCRSGIPPNRATRSFLPSRWTRASKHVRSPCGVSILALYRTAIVRVHGGRVPQQFPHPPHEPAAADQGGGLLPDPGHPPGGNLHAGQLGHQVRSPLHRDVVRAGQVRSLGAGLRPGAGPRPDERGQPALADRVAPRALLRLRDVPGDPWRRRGPDAGDLVAALRDDRRVRQVRAALPARRRRIPEPALRVIHQAHRGARLARLLPRPPLSPLPQRPVPRLLLIRAVRRRRPRRRGRILARAPLQQLHPRHQLADHPVSLSKPHRQLLMRQRCQLSAEGTPGTSGTASHHHHPRPPVNHRHGVSPSPSKASRNQQ